MNEGSQPSRPAWRDALEGLGLALQFLTRLPVPMQCDWNLATRRWATTAYPLVGLIIGLLLWGASVLLSALPEPLLALVLVSLWVAISGGLHLDGLMDLADALGSNTSLDRRWQIMKDPQVGSFAILALVFHLVWKLALVWTLLVWTFQAGASPIWLLAIPALARFMAVVLLVRVPAARSGGLAYGWQQGLGWNDLVRAAILPLVLCLGGGGVGVLMVVAGLVFVVGFAYGARRLFNGINGDMLGAAIEGGELWLMVCVSSWWWFAMA
ncbi:adenosylcobinamide-GDP ribazoletransferase [Halomonas cupida]|uniref:Adenosylcobinamide-GDP ribazoletransferase n=1 Tax=Halomonas cupida TaxID=44933 RepID=A0A1M7LAM1_9GAMM|nr:adenosylcobinamide-GDP ribazoletransferase [Halomonas cupida]GEN25198.1 adenosylcobinamide-GDP ribazoletransferase [Halomonas cupida]SHM75047.1 cobalamin-5'-phosphate synthase [Halomonas cupida]